MKFVYCGFDFFDKCLIECLEAGHELLAAFCHPVDGFYNSNESVSALCIQQGIDLQIRSLTASDVDLFKQQGCKFLVSAAFLYKVPSEALRQAGIMGFNIHPSLLPEGRGPWPLPHVILHGLKETGVTIHQLEDKLDAGPILGQARIEIASNENLETLSVKTQIAAAKLLRTIVRSLEQYWSDAQPQKGGSYWPMPSEAERSLDWNQSVWYLDKVIRAFGKFESYATFLNEDWLIQDATVWEEPHRLIPGQIAHRTNREIVVAARDGFVCLRQFKKEPKLK